MTPHEPASAVGFEIQTAPEYRSQAVEFAARFHAALLHVFGRHAARRERKHPVLIVRVQPPAIVQEPAFFFQALVQRRAWKRRQMIEGDDVEIVALRKRERFRHGVAIVFVVAEDKRDIETNPVTPQVGERFLIAALHQVEALAHALQVFRVQGFETDQQRLATTGFDQLQKFFVMGGVDTGLADPADLQWNQGPEKFLGLIHVRRDVIVDEENQRLLRPAHFLEDLFGRPARLSVTEIRLNRAEFAAKVATASSLDQSNGQIALTGKDGPVRAESTERRTLPLPIDSL